VVELQRDRRPAAAEIVGRFSVDEKERWEEEDKARQ
jgi:hypothetical protein